MFLFLYNVIITRFLCPPTTSTFLRTTRKLEPLRKLEKGKAQCTFALAIN